MAVCLTTNCKAHSPISMAASVGTLTGRGKGMGVGRQRLFHGRQHHVDFLWVQNLYAGTWMGIKKAILLQKWGGGAQQLVLDPPADPCPLILEELFSLWLPPHDRHPLSENETLVYFPETNKKSQRCSGDWGTLRFWGLSGPEPLFIPSSNKQHFRVQEAFRGQVPFVFTVPVSWGNLALKKLSAQAYVNSQAVTISPSLLSFPFSWLFSLNFFSLFKISVPQNNRPRQINVLIHSGYLPV